MAWHLASPRPQNQGRLPFWRSLDRSFFARFAWPQLLCVGMVVVGSSALAEDAPESFDALSRQYDTTARPLLKQFCLECHSTERKEGELDLERYATLAALRRAPQGLQRVVEMLDQGEMPPADSPQLSPDQKKTLRDWVSRYLRAEAYARAGDPGPVVLRRLSNAEYTYTLRDITGINSLNPAREFPVDGAAGEGFTNAGNALVMSPALLTKYLDAAKEVSKHAVLLPDGFRFSSSTMVSDWTNETLAAIREFYQKFSDSGGGMQVNLQGIVFDTNTGGRLAVEKYLAATIVDREAIQSGRKSLAESAREHGLNAKYLGILWHALNGGQSTLLLDEVRSHWRTASPQDAAALAAEVHQWQQALWRFTSVGHIGKLNGPRAWQEPVLPIAASQDLRLKLAAAPGEIEITLYLLTSDAGDGNAQDFAVWERPRLVAPGRPDLLLKDVRGFAKEMTARRGRLFAATGKALAVVAEASQSTDPIDAASLAKKRDIDVDLLTPWFDLLGVGASSTDKLDRFTNKINNASGYAFIKGWGSDQTPLILANSSDQHVRVPGNMKPHGVCVHPSPALLIAAGWRSPVTGNVRIEGRVTHAHPECGNGVTWSLELRRGTTRQRLAAGVAHGPATATIGPLESIAVRPGDLVSLLIGPRDGNHSCDLTDIELVLKENSTTAREWSLTADVSPDIQAGNPHADRLGNAGVWHFYTEPVRASDTNTVIPPGSLLARWQGTEQATEREKLAAQLQRLLLEGPTQGSPDTDPDTVLYRQLASLGGPLLVSGWQTRSNESNRPTPSDESGPGISASQFGKHPDGSAIDKDSLCVRAPSVIAVRLPADIIAGAEFVATTSLHSASREGSVQCQVLTTKPTRTSGLLTTAASETTANGPWTSNNRGVAHSTPVIANDGSETRRRLEDAFDAFRSLFPIALCYTKIVPVDEVVTLTLYYREDEPLRRLMLDEAQTRQLNRLWDELHFVSQDALKLVDAYAQLMEYATQDADPKVFEPLRKPIHDRADAFRQIQVDAERKHVDAILAFAPRVYRRPLSDVEKEALEKLYAGLRAQELHHEDAFRMTLARMLVAPAFLYRVEQPRPGTEPAPISGTELASRLSYFLWSSAPDEELREVAATGRLNDPEVLRTQTRRMLKDPRTRRLATEFACQWLHIYDFDQLDEKSERHFPTFVGLRGDMYEESIQFFTDLFQNDRSVLEILDADYTFLNESLAAHYGIPDVRGPEWRRVDGVRKYARGGILGQATTLAKQSGASRTSPILRGNWISEVVLGERLPRPPKGVPQLPDDETATAGLTVRQLVEKHSSDPKCAGCHRRIDPFGFALEAYDAIGRRREKDLADRPIDARTTTADGHQVNGLTGLRDYLANVRREAFLRQFCRKLLGYSLGRSVQLSDEPLLAEMRSQLETNGFRTSVVVDLIVQSRQFREIRGKDMEVTE